MMGEIDADLKTVTAKLGKPLDVDGEWTSKRWLIQFDDGLVATIFTSPKYEGLFVGGFGQYNKQKENLALLAVKELFNE